MPSVVHPAGQPDLVAQAAKVFGNTVRLSIINVLKHGPALRADLVAQTGLPAKTLGAQLAELEALGVVKAEAQHSRGRPMLYYANQSRLEELLSALSQYVLEGVSDIGARGESH
ncbi:ArsR/SmtB family transcription factor [Kocuria dechangensis]|uniref:ArsR/SmtB family transcription factor n=1 Tax=Kocuria dechangensis TaxID=1176249 RepID=UPI001663EA53|nr:winged helix-turn-helix transcriptional regulator [Kocuria dechangensis]